MAGMLICSLLALGSLAVQRLKEKSLVVITCLINNDRMIKIYV